jgi:hypothetical protein
MARQVWPQLAWLQVPHRKDRLSQLLLLLRPVLLVLLLVLRRKGRLLQLLL